MRKTKPFTMFVTLLLLAGVTFGADQDRTSVARDTIRSENKRLETSAQQIKGLLERARIADPDVLALYQSRIDMMTAAIDLNNTILQQGNEDLQVVAAKAIVGAAVERKYDEIEKKKQEITDKTRVKGLKVIDELRREISDLKVKLKLLQG